MVIEEFRKKANKEGQKNGYYSAWSLKVDLRQFNKNLQITEGLSHRE